MEPKSPPPFLPPRTPYFAPKRQHSSNKRSSWPPTRQEKGQRSRTPPPYLPPRRPYSAQVRQSVDTAKPLSGVARPTIIPTRSFRSRRSSLQSIPDDVELETPTETRTNVTRSNSDGPRRLTKYRPHRVASSTTRDSGRLQPVAANEQCVNGSIHGVPRRNHLRRQSSLLRIEQKVDDDGNDIDDVDESIQSNRSDALRILESGAQYRKPSPRRSSGRVYSSSSVLPPLPPVATEVGMSDAFSAPPVETSPSQPIMLIPKPRISLKRLSSLDNFMSYQEEVAAWKRASSIWEQQQSEHRQSDLELSSVERPGSDVDVELNEAVGTEKGVVDFEPEPPFTDITRPPAPEPPSTVASSMSSQHGTCINEEIHPYKPSASGIKPETKFRHPVTEAGFTFAIAMSQLLGEFLISGFALELSKLANAEAYNGGGQLGLFWPASLLSLILSATLLVFARLSDMHSGYPWFMFGLIWLTLWTLIPAFVPTLVVLDVSRAMQGLAIAAFTPSTFVMVGTVYEDGPRKNFVMGLYSGCAPLGFFAGFLTAGALSTRQAYWWFWIVAAASALTAIVAWLCVPHDRTNRKQAGLEMDWAGALLITAGLILVAYALAVSTYGRWVTASPTFYAPLVAGVICLLLAVWVEGWWAKTPLLPFSFFEAKSVKAFCLAGLFFYASYGVWLYNTTDFFESNSGTVGQPGTPGISGITLAIWYTPTAIGGVIMCVLTGALLHIIPPKILLLVSGLAWIGASLIFAVCPYPVSYWSAVLPSMICATLGLDLTYTVSLVYLSSVQPDELQGLCGAICSILINLAMSFSLSIAEIVKDGASSTHKLGRREDSAYSEAQWVLRSAFIYAAASAAIGFFISVVFVRIPKAKARVLDEEQPATEGQHQNRAGSPSNSVTTLVEDHEDTDGMITAVNSAEPERA